MRQQNIRVERGNKGFGLSLIYKVSLSYKLIEYVQGKSNRGMKSRSRNVGMLRHVKIIVTNSHTCDKPTHPDRERK